MRALARWITFRHLAGTPGRTALTLAGVALGVAVFVSIRLAEHSALASFSRTVDAVAGRANLQVTGGTEGFDERLFPIVRAAPGVTAAAPVVELFAPARAGGPRPAGMLGPAQRGPYRETVLLLGIDLFSEAPFARTDTVAATRGDDLALLTDPSAVAVTRTLARRLRLGVGDTLTVLASGRPVPLVVRRILASPTLGEAFAGNVGVVDLATAQERFHRLGRLDRIDLIVPSAQRDAVAAALARALPPGLQVTNTRGRTKQVENMVRAFALNLLALSFIALFVSTFLIFNAVSLAVVRRRGEIGILRAIGVTRAQVLVLIAAEGCMYGAVGGALGLVAGTLLARLTVGAVSRTLADLYLVRGDARVSADPATYVIAFALGLAIAVVSSLAPALEASRIPPAATLRQGRLIEARRPPFGRLAAAGGVLIAAGAAVSWWTLTGHHPLGGFASAFLVLAGFSLVSPPATLAIARLAIAPARRVAGITGALGARTLGESAARGGVVAAALMVSVGMLVALGIMVGSFRRTVDTWVTQTIRGDLYIEPVGHRLTGSATALPPAFLDRLARIPGVAAIDTYRGSRIDYRGQVAFFAGIDFAVQSQHGRLQFVKGDSRRVLVAARAERACIVTESFARRYDVRAGDTLALDVPAGRVRLPVAGVFYDYSTDAGAVLVDRGLYARLTGDPRVESLAMFLSPGVPLAPVRAAVEAASGDSLVLSVMPNQALRARVLTVFDQTFQITWALQLISVIVAVLGVIGTLTALISQRARDFGVLRAVGATRGQVRGVVLVESALIGLTGAALGCVAGVALALILIHVINTQFFGWTIRTTFAPAVFVRALLLTVATATLAGLAPAARATGRATADALRMD